MKTASVRELRNRFPQVAAWIKQGQAVQITKAGKVFAHLTPPPVQKPQRFKMPDIMARLHQDFDRVYEVEDMAKGLEESRGQLS